MTLELNTNDKEVTNKLLKGFKLPKDDWLPSLVTEFVYEGAVLTLSGIKNLRVECSDGLIVSVTELEGELNLHRLLMPGLVDGHVHYRDFEQSSKETIETGSYHSMMTGVMEVRVMPNVMLKPVRLIRNKSISDVEGGLVSNLDDYNRIEEYDGVIIQPLSYPNEEVILEQVGSNVRVTYLEPGPIDNLDRLIVYKEACSKAHIPTRVRSQLTPYLNERMIKAMSNVCNHWKAFIGKSENVAEFNDYETLDKKVSLLPAGSIINFHCEDPEVLSLNKSKWNPMRTETHYDARPPEAEIKAIREVINLSKKYSDKEFIICHVSTKEGINLLRQAKQEQDNIKAESCYHYFRFTVDRLTNSMFKCNPPLRREDDVNALFNALLDGTIDYLSSDHAPHTRADKIRNASGMPSYNSGAIGWLINEGLRRYSGDELNQYLINLLKASSLNIHPEWEIKEGNPVRMIMLNMKERWVREKDIYSKAFNVSPWVGEALPRLELLIHGDQVIYNPL